MRTKEEQEKIRATLASQILNNPLFEEVLTSIEDQVYNEFKNTTFDQKEERDELWRQTKVVSLVKKKLVSAINKYSYNEKERSIELP